MSFPNDIENAPRDGSIFHVMKSDAQLTGRFGAFDRKTQQFVEYTFGPSPDGTGNLGPLPSYFTKFSE